MTTTRRAPRISRVFTRFGVRTPARHIAPLPQVPGAACRKSWPDQTIGWSEADDARMRCWRQHGATTRWRRESLRIAPSFARSRQRERRSLSVALPLLPAERADSIAAMTDRRRTPRYVLGPPLRGEAMPMEDVTIESYALDRMVVVSPSLHRVEDELMVHVTTATGLTSRRGTVLSSTAVSRDGVLCYRIEMRTTDVNGDGVDRTDGTAGGNTSAGKK
jgi:hypothetical protein